MNKIYLILFLILSAHSYTSAQLIINEVLYDPSNTALEGDANGDSIYSQTEDEFIEFVNTGITPLNVSGYQIIDDSANNTIVFTIPNGTIIPPNGALVIFGGGNPRGLFGGATVLADTGAGLNLNNSGEIILIKNALGQTILRFNSDELSNNPNESYTRSPDLTGNFVQHTVVNSRKFSPGTKLNGTPFITGFPKQITFKVDLSKQVQSIDSVFISGNFNSYCLSCTPLTDINNNRVFEASISSLLDTFYYQFVYKIENSYIEEGLVLSACTQEVNGKQMRFLKVGSDSILGAVCLAECMACKPELSLKGVTDFITPARGNSGKAIHLFADSTISNLSIYGLGVANNGGGTDGQEYRFPAISVLAGTHILLARDTSALLPYFGECKENFGLFLIDNLGIVNQNGNDAIELFRAGSAIETYGNVNEDGTGKTWEYTGAWAYKTNTGIWINGQINCTDSTETIYDSECIYPICADVKITQITINSSSNTIATPAGTLSLSAQILPVNAPNKSIVWSVDSPNIASINNNGILTAIANGVVVVKASSTDGSNVFGIKTITISGQSNAIQPAQDIIFSVHPNPAKDFIYITSSISPTAYVITDMLGSTKENASLQNREISLKELGSGIYFMDIYFGESLQRIKIIKH